MRKRKKFRRPREMCGYFHLRVKELENCGPHAPDGLGVITIGGQSYKLEARRNEGGDFNLWAQLLGPDGKPARKVPAPRAPTLRKLVDFFRG